MSLESAMKHARGRACSLESDLESLKAEFSEDPARFLEWKTDKVFFTLFMAGHMDVVIGVLEDCRDAEEARKRLDGLREREENRILESPPMPVSSGHMDNYARLVENKARCAFVRGEIDQLCLCLES